MSEQFNPGRTLDSLEVVELMMAVEEVIDADTSLTPAQRERLLHEIEARIKRGEFGDLDDGALGILVRKLGPRGPSGHAGAAVKPDDALDPETLGPSGYVN
jgi:hypothetical protein